MTTTTSVALADPIPGPKSPSNFYKTMQGFYENIKFKRIFAGVR